MATRGRIGFGTLVAALSLPAAVAHAGVAGVTVTDAAGVEQTVSAALSVRTLTPTIHLQLQPNATQSYAVSVIGPNSAVAGEATCGLLQDGLPLSYRGNGVYNIVVQSYPTSSCSEQIGPTQTFSFTQASSVALTAPAAPVLLRDVNATGLRPITIPVRRVPGGTVEVRFAKDGALDGAGGILGGGIRAGIDGAGTAASFTAKEPGSYVAVARQSVDAFSTPWSAPAIVKLVAPFDLAKLTYPDTGGPVYQVRGVVREPAVAGETVTVMFARGASGGSFGAAREVTVQGDGSFVTRFKAKSGPGRLKVSFRGNVLVTRGEQVGGFTVRAGRLRVRRLLS